LTLSRKHPLGMRDTHDIDRIRDNDETFVYPLRPQPGIAMAVQIPAKDEDYTQAAI
jgi:hypothetical protein